MAIFPFFPMWRLRVPRRVYLFRVLIILFLFVSINFIIRKVPHQQQVGQSNDIIAKGLLEKDVIHITYVTFPSFPTYRCVDEGILRITLLHNPSVVILSPPSCFEQYAALAAQISPKRIYYYDVKDYFDKDVETMYREYRWKGGGGRERFIFERDCVIRYFVMRNWMNVHRVKALYTSDHDVVNVFNVKDYWKRVHGTITDVRLTAGLGVSSFWGRKALNDFCIFIRREMSKRTRTGLDLSGLHDMMMTQSFVHLTAGLDAREGQRAPHQKGQAGRMRLYETIERYNIHSRTRNWLTRNKDVLITARVFPLPVYDDINGYAFDHNVHSLSHFSSNSYVGINGTRNVSWAKNNFKNVEGFKQIVMCGGLPYFVYNNPTPRLVRAITVHFQGNRKRTYLPEFVGMLTDEDSTIRDRCVCADVACSRCKNEKKWLDSLKSSPLEAQMSICGDRGLGVV